MDVQHVSVPLYSGDYAWKLPYKILPENKVKLGVILENSKNTVRIKSVSDKLERRTGRPERWGPTAGN